MVVTLPAFKHHAALPAEGGGNRCERLYASRTEIGNHQHTEQFSEIEPAKGVRIDVFRHSKSILISGTEKFTAHQARRRIQRLLECMGQAPKRGPRNGLFSAIGFQRRFGLQSVPRKNA
jgi:hypothetical protein